jgi:hypothetical protein
VSRYDDLVQLARICSRQANGAESETLAAELRRMAEDYARRAAALDGGESPEIDD